ncbi:stage III sporulation protein AG [Hathewaya histolytica]|uniref:stage III sporulation protein AG n=1 Tax=Hathewaya histolytica TaxID=1498 RepID=UPI003B66ED16
MEDLMEKIKKKFKDILNNESKERKEDTKSKIKKNSYGNLIILVLIGSLFVIGGNLLSKQSKNIAVMNRVKEDDKTQKESETNIRTSGDYKSEIDLKEYSENLNNKLKNILGLIDGVGKVDSLIYFDGGEEYVPATNINNSISKTEETDTSGGKRKIDQNNDGKTIVTFNDGNSTKPLIKNKKNPKITGVCIVAEGADNKVTELRIVEAVVNLFNLPDKKVQVYPMKR